MPQPRQRGDTHVWAHTGKSIAVCGNLRRVKGLIPSRIQLIQRAADETHARQNAIEHAEKCSANPRALEKFVKVTARLFNCR